MSATPLLDVELSGAEWERRLVFHYLRSDGPSGGTPLHFLDATPAEIATASGLSNIGDLEAQEAFVSHFSLSSIEGWLSGDYRPPTRSESDPTYFRFLVLTCLVSATDTGAGSTQNFRIRLGELLAAGPFNAVNGVNDLWRSLERWCDRKRAAGEPFRRIVLPDPGSATLIGCAVRIAFPSWRDRSVLTNILRKIPPITRRKPERLIQELARPKFLHQLSSSVASALEDFTKNLRARRQMLLGHRFWRLVQSIEARIAEQDKDPRNQQWRLDVRFGGYEQDETSLSLFLGNSVLGNSANWEGSIQQLAAVSASTLPLELSEALRHQVLMLYEGDGAAWSIDQNGLSLDRTLVLLARVGSMAASLPLATNWRALEGGWLVSGKLDPSSVLAFRRRLGMAPPIESPLVDLSFVRGVKISHSSWLGRPNFLPTVAASEASAISLDQLSSSSGSLTLTGRSPTWTLLADRPISGRWRVCAKEASLETEKIICFEDVVPEKWDFSTKVGGFEPEHELLDVGEKQQHVQYPKDIDSEPISSLLWDVLEAIYASPSNGWPENALIETLSSVLPKPHFEWDFLRGLAEADWLEPVVSTSWRARIWRLRAPYFEIVAPNLAVLRGAVGSAARRRLVDAVTAAGGKLVIRAGVSAWAPPTLVVQGDIHSLSDDLTWPMREHARPIVEAAPNCWPTEARTGQGRLIAGVWRYDLGLFLAPEKVRSNEAILLERLARERGDDRDVYRIRGRGESFVTASRTIAILEAHRMRKDPLFDWSFGLFVRRSRGGHLPLLVARTLGVRSMRASGPFLREDGSWTYAYSADSLLARWVAETFGAAININSETLHKPFHQHVAEQRRRGRRPSWFTTQNTSHC